MIEAAFAALADVVAVVDEALPAGVDRPAALAAEAGATDEEEFQALHSRSPSESEEKRNQ